MDLQREGVYGDDTDGHHRIPQAEIERLLPRTVVKGDAQSVRRNLRRISGRNQLVGRILELKFDGLFAQVTLSIGEQHITSIMTADAARELQLCKGQVGAALIKPTEAMTVLPR